MMASQAVEANIQADVNLNLVVGESFKRRQTLSIIPFVAFLSVCLSV